MLYSDECRWQEIVDSQLVIDSHWQWIWYIFQMIDLKFIDCSVLRLMLTSSSACWTTLAAAWYKIFDSDELFDFDDQIWSSYQDNDEFDQDLWFENASWFDS